MIRTRPTLFATMAVVVLLAGGATMVFALGSKQRREDRKAFLAYERAISGSLTEVRRVAGEMRAGGSGMTVADEWRATLAASRSSIAGVEAPSFLRAVRTGLLRAIDSYGAAARAQAADEPATSALHTGDDEVERAMRLLDFHRRRLGLQPSS